MGNIKIITTGSILVLLVAGLLLLGGCIPPEGTEGETGGLGGMWPMLIFIVLLFVLMYFVMIRPQRRRQQEHDQLVQELRRGDKVVTAGGIYGQVESISDDTVILKVESGATIRVARSSISGKQIDKRETEEPRIG